MFKHRFFATLLIPGIVLLAGSAAAHRVNVFAWVDGDTVHVESKFSGGNTVKAGKVTVSDLLGRERVSGRTDDDGKFDFKITERTDLRIVLVAGQGHQGEWTVRASEMTDLPAAPASSTPDRAESTGNRAVSDDPPPADADSATTTVDVRPEELEAMIAAILDKKLKPIIGMLVEIRQGSPTFKDVAAGIGYIVGIVGIAAFVQSRKKKG